MLRDPRDFLTFSAVYRTSSGYGRDAEIVEAIVFETGELSELLALTPDELSDAVRAWALAHGDPLRTVALTRSETDIGAAAVSLALVVTFLGGAAAELALEELYHFVRGRLIRTSTEEQRLKYFAALDDEMLVDELRARVARATDHRGADLRLVQAQRASEEMSAVFETVTGVRYVIRATDELYRIATVRDGDGQ